MEIPKRVPRGYEIPIALTSTANDAEKGKFVRLGLDVAVNATWLALKWAIEEGPGSYEVVGALHKLITDWPFDFIFFEGNAEAQANDILKYIINLPAAVERMRDFCGLESANLMRITG